MSNFWKIFISVVATIIIIGGGTYYTMQKRINSMKSDNLASELNNLPKPPSIDGQDTPGWKTYSDKAGVYSFKYPADWTLSENSNNSVTLETPAEKKAGDQCAADAIKNGGGDCSTLGSELFAVYTFPNSTKLESSEEIYALQDSSINGVPAKFFIDPAIDEHYVWEIQKGVNSYEVEVRTPGNLFVGSNLITADDYYKALTSAQSFKLN
ncbi:MAG: hypothetical protein NTY30_02415 [Candidatus Berkelbacteria bacterium]|nr:hypothetical protein [Candidatus Berkelbacteria bacterium]